MAKATQNQDADRIRNEKYKEEKERLDNVAVSIRQVKLARLHHAEHTKILETLRSREVWVVGMYERGLIGESTYGEVLASIEEDIARVSLLADMDLQEEGQNQLVLAGLSGARL